MRKAKLIGKLFGIVLVLVVITGLVGSSPVFVSQAEASPGTIYVPADYPTIQAAVDAANPGDTIIVSHAIYHEDLTIGKQLTLIGVSYPVVDGTGPQESTIIITADGVTIQGFDVAGATASPDPPGAAIRLYHVQGCLIENNDIHDNASNGISLVNSNHNTVINNRCWRNTDGIKLWSQSPMTTSYNLIHNNTCFENSRYGIESWSYVYLTVTSKNNEITENCCCSNNYGGIYLAKSTNSTLCGNNCSYNEQYGINLDTYPGSVTRNNSIVNNVISNNNYGIRLYGTSAQNTENTVVGNAILDNRACGIYLNSAYNNQIYQNNLIGNTNNVHSLDSTNIWNSLEEIIYTYNDNTYTSFLGNYWDDYIGSDADGDGIGETPYPIDSDNDNYPLVELFENYEIARIIGETRAVNSDILPGVTIALYQDDVEIASTVSSMTGKYDLAVPELGDYSVTASKDGFRDKTQAISVNEATTYTLDFVGNYGLVPDAPNMSYVLASINLWKFGTPPCNLNMSTVLAVINAWKFPI